MQCHFIVTGKEVTLVSSGERLIADKNLKVGTECKDWLQKQGGKVHQLPDPAPNSRHLDFTSLLLDEPRLSFTLFKNESINSNSS